MHYELMGSYQTLGETPQAVPISESTAMWVPSKRESKFSLAPADWLGIEPSLANIAINIGGWAIIIAGGGLSIYLLNRKSKKKVRK